METKTKANVVQLRKQVIEQIKKVDMSNVKRNNIINDIKFGGKVGLNRAMKYVTVALKIKGKVTMQKIKEYKLSQKAKSVKASSVKASQSILKNHPDLLDNMYNEFKDYKRVHYNAKNVTKLGVKVEGATSNIISFKIGSSNNSKFTTKQVEKISKDFNKFLKNEKIKGKIMVSMNVGPYWRSGIFTNIGDNIDIYESFIDSDGNNMETPDEIKDVAFYFYEDGNRYAGGDNETNDCLYDAIKYYVPIMPP